MQFTNPLYNNRQQDEPLPIIIVTTLPQRRNYNLIYIHITGAILLICISIGIAYFINDRSFRGTDIAIYIAFTLIVAIYFTMTCVCWLCCSGRSENSSHLEDVVVSNRELV